MSEQAIGRIGDIVQCTQGLDKVIIGLVMGVTKTHYLCWMKEPTDYGGRRIDFRLRMEECQVIGRGKMRPLLSNEAQPEPPPNRPQPAKAQPVLPARATVRSPSVAAPVEQAAQAEVSLPEVEEVDPEDLEVKVFRRPSAWDAHNLTPPGDPLAPPPPAPEPPKAKRRRKTKRTKRKE